LEAQARLDVFVKHSKNRDDFSEASRKRRRSRKNAGLTLLQARQISDKTQSRGKKWPKI